MLALSEGFQIREMVGKSFCINASVIVELVLQLRLSLASNLDWPANSRHKFEVSSRGPRSTAASKDFSTPTGIVTPSELCCGQRTTERQNSREFACMLLHNFCHIIYKYGRGPYKTTWRAEVGHCHRLNSSGSAAFDCCNRFHLVSRRRR